MPVEKPKSNGSYLKLFIVVLAAVTIGNFLFTWITAEVTAYKVRAAATQVAEHLQAAAERARQSAEANRIRSERAAKAVLARQQEERRHDAFGVKLGQACTEWAKADSEMKSYTTRTERDKACSRLAEYVESGRRLR